MRKSKADTAATRQRILAAASGVLLRDGLANTGIADIMAAAGLAPGGFYRHFASKDQLVAEASAAAFGALHAMFDSATAGMAPQQALELIVQRYLHQLQARQMVYLCPLANLGSELRHAEGQVRVVTGEGYAGLVKIFAALLLRMDIADYVGVAETIVTTLVGAVSLSRLVVEPASASAMLANAQQAVNFLVRNAATSKTQLNRARQAPGRAPAVPASTRPPAPAHRSAASGPLRPDRA